MTVLLPLIHSEFPGYLVKSHKRTLFPALAKRAEESPKVTEQILGRAGLEPKTVDHLRFLEVTRLRLWSVDFRVLQEARQIDGWILGREQGHFCISVDF